MSPSVTVVVPAYNYGRYLEQCVASVLGQPGVEVGLDAFVAGIRQYFKDHAFGNTEFSDLLAALEKSSGRELTSWAQEWLQTAGVNTLAPSFELDADGNYASFSVTQTAHPDWPTLRRHRLGIGLYDDVELERAADRRSGQRCPRPGRDRRWRVPPRRRRAGNGPPRPAAAPNS